MKTQFLPRIAFLTAFALLPVAAFAATPTQDTLLNVSLLPNSVYEVTANVSTNDAAGLITLLLGGESPLQILDDHGNVLGTVPAQSLIDLLTGLTGTVTRQINTLITTAGEAVGNITARTLDVVPIVQVSGVTVRAVSTANQAPTVTVKSKKHQGPALRLRGTASDDGRVSRVEVIVNGRIHRAKGTTTWNYRAAMRVGTNRIAVRAFDNTGMTSPTRRFKSGRTE